MAQSVKRPNFSLGRDRAPCGFEPRVRLRAGGAEPAWDSLSLSLSPSLSAPPLLARLGVPALPLKTKQKFLKF